MGNNTSARFNAREVISLRNGEAASQEAIRLTS